MIRASILLWLVANFLIGCSSDPRDVPVLGPESLNTHCSTGEGRVVRDKEGTWYVECPPFRRRK